MYHPTYLLAVAGSSIHTLDGGHGGFRLGRDSGYKRSGARQKEEDSAEELHGCR